MILEGLITTTSVSGGAHLAPMGPCVQGDFQTLLLRPYKSSTTYKNLLNNNCGVFHITDDARLIAYAAVGRVPAMPKMLPANVVQGFTMPEACRAYEFIILDVDDSQERVQMTAEVVAKHTFRDFLGFHRAKHAVLEAAILMTRLHILPRHEVEAEMRKLRIIVDKTAGPEEQEAMGFLEEYLYSAQ
jgi:hypothetical protein